MAAAEQSRDSTSGFNANGQQTTQNKFIMDGLHNNNSVMGMQDRKAEPQRSDRLRASAQRLDGPRLIGLRVHRHHPSPATTARSHP